MICIIYICIYTDILYFLLNNSLIPLFQGSNLQTGSTVEDFKVWIGNASCSISDLTQSVLQCEPPIEQPAQQSDGHLIAGAVQVIVSRILN